MCKDKPIDVFVSHFSPESVAADLVERLLKVVFGQQLSVFVSYKIPVGDQWYPTILDSLGRSCVIVVLLSRQSVGTRWINFEAGFGAGAGGRVLPFTIGDLKPGEVGLPLSALQVLRLNERGNIRQLLERISIETGRPIRSDGDIEVFSKELSAVEEGLLGNSIYLRPFLTGRRIDFELMLQGDMPVRLIKLWAAVPSDVYDHNQGIYDISGHMRHKTESIGGTPHLVTELYAGDLPIPIGTPTAFQRLLPDFTPTMSGQVIENLLFLLKEDMGYTDWRQKLRYQAFVREFPTYPQAIELQKVEHRN